MPVAIARYSNNVIHLASDNGLVTDTFWAVIETLKANKNDDVVSFSFSELRKISGFDGVNFEKTLTSISATIADLPIQKDVIDDDGNLIFSHYLNLFTVRIDEKSKKVMFKLDSNAKNFLSDFSKKAFKELSKIKSKYVRNLYLVLNASRKVGRFSGNKKLIYNLLEVPKGYFKIAGTANIKIIIPAVAELVDKKFFKELKVQFLTKPNPHGGSEIITGYKFLF